MKTINLLQNILITTIALACIATTCFAEDYTKFSNEVRSNPEVQQFISKDPKRVQVLLFFNYGCHECNSFEPSFEQWESKHGTGNVKVYRMPIAFNDEWENLVKLYYVMAELAPNTDFNAKIFAAIHNQDQKLWQEDEMREFVIKNGFTAEDFERAYNSPAVTQKAQQAQSLSLIYGIDQTPSVVVNGPNSSYLLTLEQAGGASNLFSTVDALTRKEEKTSTN